MVKLQISPIKWKRIIGTLLMGSLVTVSFWKSVNLTSFLETSRNTSGKRLEHYFSIEDMGSHLDSICIFVALQFCAVKQLSGHGWYCGKPCLDVTHPDGQTTSIASAAPSPWFLLLRITRRQQQVDLKMLGSLEYRQLLILVGNLRFVVARAVKHRWVINWCLIDGWVYES